MTIDTAPDSADRSAHDDLSTYTHRQVIGYLGMSLPLMVWFIAGVRPADDARNIWHPLTSISGYYHTSGVVAFVGVLAGLSIYLLTYKGFDNQHGKWDRRAAWTAGVCSALVALFPTQAPGSGPHWLQPWVYRTHYGSAAVLFSSFAFFSLYLFTKSSGAPDRDKRRRNRVYYGCGIAIVVSIAWIIVLKVGDLLSSRATGMARDSSIFWPETIALVAFAVSWLTKGRAVRGLKAKAATIAQGVRTGVRHLSGAR
jgi:hypothetical protein